MKRNEQDYPHSELSKQIIASAYRVIAEIKNGLREKIYENALCVDFAEQNIYFSQQQQYPVFYHNKPLGTLIPDLIVDNKIIVDTKVVQEINSEHISQMQGYLNITGLEIGLIINFKYASVTIRRIANLKDYNLTNINLQ